ncbi:hypothetical protein BDZ97DRAFT_2047280 [Flammula alnicola]|nr:hypothetical protein BDZ97DRAFT_2047280 [Flammula alnicola]
MSPIVRPQYDSPSGTRIVLLAQEGGDPIAYGTISPQLTSLASRKSKTKSGSLTLEELRTSSLVSGHHSSVFQVVSPLLLIDFDRRENGSIPLYQDIIHPSAAGRSEINIDQQDNNDDDIGVEVDEESLPEDVNLVTLDMLEAYSQIEENKTNDTANQNNLPPASGVVVVLQKIIESPPDLGSEYTPDHLLRWDPIARASVDETCRKVFNLTFDQMLIQNPRFIAERTPRHVPAPSILVPALHLVFETFGNALDVKTNLPLFNADAHHKAKAVLVLARQGYLSDIEGVSLYERAGIDKYGLQKWKCLRGTNNVEGGPHGDIYQKFGALHAGPRLTVNCLTDHRTWYNLQAFAKHIFGVDWDYHHDLGLINRTSFLLNYLSDVVDGSTSYAEWINGDLYERTEEQFGICIFPEALRIRLGMEPYSEDAETQFKLNTSDSWLRKWQGLALPVLPPTTPESRKFFFSKIREFAARARLKMDPAQDQPNDDALFQMVSAQRRYGDAADVFKRPAQATTIS